MQPVYLLLRLKKGKGNETPAYDTQSSVERRKKLAYKISINGNTIDFLHQHINIHDFAEFEKTEQLIPEFRLSIKSKTPHPLVRQAKLSEEGDDSSKKTDSFRDVARQVFLMENALARWPRRPRSRHHSSSSEDLVEDESGVEADDISVHTDVSELSETEDLKAGPGNNNTNLQVADDSMFRQRSSEGLNNGTDNESVAKTDISQNINISGVHDQGISLHGHDTVKVKVKAVKEPSQEREHTNGSRLCPSCVVV